MKYEIVYTYVWYSGPRSGVADYKGTPHFFESDWSDFTENKEDDSFYLMPVEQSTRDLAIEQWEIWRRWEKAFHHGDTTIETHPVLPDERERYDVLENSLKQLLVMDESRSFLRNADFRIRQDSKNTYKGIEDFEVRWMIPSSTQ